MGGGLEGRLFPAERPLVDLCKAVPDYPPAPELIEHLKPLLDDPATSRYSPDEGAQAQAAVADAEAPLAAARDIMRQMQVRAPITGTVYSIDTSATEYTDAGKLLKEDAQVAEEFDRLMRDGFRGPREARKQA